MISAVFLVSCQTPATTIKPVTVCVSDPQSGGIFCSLNGEARVLITFDKTENYICLPPESARIVLTRPEGQDEQRKKD